MKKLCTTAILSLFLIFCKGQILENSYAGKTKSGENRKKVFNDLTFIDLDTSFYKLPENLFSSLTSLTDLLGQQITNSRIDSLRRFFPLFKTELVNPLIKTRAALMRRDSIEYSNIKERIKTTSNEIESIDKRIASIEKIISDSTQIKNKKDRDIFEAYLKLIKKDNERLKEENRKLETNKEELFLLINEIKTANIDQSINSYIDFTQANERLSKAETKIEKIYRDVAENDKKISDQKKSILEALKKFELLSEKDDTKKDNAAALPFINTIPEAKNINAAISLFGNTTIDNWESIGVFIQFGGFTGSISGANDLHPKSLFIPENSAYGFFVKSSFGFYTKDLTSTKQFGFNFEGYYTHKKINPDTVKFKKAFTPGVIHIKGGLEYAFIKDLFSIYTNVNALSITDDSQEFEAYFLNSKKLRGFVDWGVRMLLNPSKNLDLGGLKLFLDLNFIVNGGDVKRVINSNDSWTPNLKFGIRKGFRL